MPLIHLIVRRVAILVLLLLVTSFAAFLLLYLSPGSPETVLLGDKPPTRPLCMHSASNTTWTIRLWCNTANGWGRP